MVVAVWMEKHHDALRLFDFDGVERFDTIFDSFEFKRFAEVYYYCTIRSYL